MHLFKTVVDVTGGHRVVCVIDRPRVVDVIDWPRVVCVIDRPRGVDVIDWPRVVGVNGGIVLYV